MAGLLSSGRRAGGGLPAAPGAPSTYDPAKAWDAFSMDLAGTMPVVGEAMSTRELGR